MKNILIIFSCLVFAGLPLVSVQAVESSAVENTDVETSAERMAWAKSLFEGRCQMCHQLPEPSMLKPKQWRLILGTMQQRMQQASVPPLTEDETERLLEYLAAEAG